MLLDQFLLQLRVRTSYMPEWIVRETVRKVIYIKGRIWLHRLLGK